MREDHQEDGIQRIRVGGGVKCLSEKVLRLERTKLKKLKKFCRRRRRRR